MVRHPYRAVIESTPPPVSTGAFEERCVAVVLFGAGSIGLFVGACAPSAHGTELVLGLLFASLALTTCSRSAASSETREVSDADP